MNAKKLLSLILALVMMLSVGMLASCDSGNKSGNDATDTAASTDGSVANEGEAKKTLVMATNATFPPYEFYDGESIVGIDAEIAQAIADKLGMELKIEDMEFNSIINAVQNGSVDFGMAGMTVTEDRLKSVDFSDSYATGVQVVIVKEDSDIASVDDLTGKKIGVQLSTTGDIYASDTPDNGGFGEENVEKYSKGADAVIALTQGKVDAVIIDNEPAKEFVKANEGLKILETEFVSEDYAIAFAKKTPSLRTRSTPRSTISSTTAPSRKSSTSTSRLTDNSL